MRLFKDKAPENHYEPNFKFKSKLELLNYQAST